VTDKPLKINNNHLIFHRYNVTKLTIRSIQLAHTILLLLYVKDIYSCFRITDNKTINSNPYEHYTLHLRSKRLTNSLRPTPIRYSLYSALMGYFYSALPLGPSILTYPHFVT